LKDSKRIMNRDRSRVNPRKKAQIVQTKTVDARTFAIVDDGGQFVIRINEIGRQEVVIGPWPSSAKAQSALEIHLAQSAAL
jgi:hypothetical protein